MSAKRIQEVSRRYRMITDINRSRAIAPLSQHPKEIDVITMLKGFPEGMRKRLNLDKRIAKSP
jgi:hypothetical protein